MTETKENCRKQTGNLKINNKLYAIYEGLNIIGRDAKSTIILKETIFSKLHAAISVVDANTHLVCDLNSSNGTQLGKLKLIPYKFYSIKDHEPIIFGDVVAMYFKGTEFQNNCVVKMSSQNVDHEASTQILNHLNNTVENIHDLPTQPFVAGEEEPKVPTQIDNIHEAPTQNFPENQPECLNIHEAPTQIFPDTNNLKNIHEAETQYFPHTNNIKNIHEAETQYSPKTNKSKNIHEDETQYFPEANKSENNIHEAPTQYFKPEDDSIINDKNSSNYNINDSDDDTTQDLDPQKIETPKEIEDRLEEPKKIEAQPEDAPEKIEAQPEVISNTQNNDEDLLSRTETYDDIFANESFRSSLERSSVEIEAVEVDETVLVESQKNPENEQFKKPEIPGIINYDVLSDDDDIILSTQDSEAIDRKYREHQEEVNSTMDKSDEKIMEEVCDSDATDVEDEELLIANVEKLIGTSEVPETPETPKIPDIPEVMNEEIAKNDINDDCSDEEELDLLASTASKSESNSEESIKNDEDVIIEAELAPTQLLTTATTSTKEAINSSDDETDDELPATQLLHLISNKGPKEKDDVFLSPKKLIPESAGKKSKTDDEDIYLAATQKLSADDEKNTSANEEIEEIPAAPKSDDSKTDEEATQMLPPEVVKTTSVSHNNKDDSVYSAATQLLPLENHEDDQFEAATQLLPLEPETKDNPTDPKTPKPIETNKDPLENYENIFSAATQLLPLANEIPDTSKNLVPNDEESIFSAATQILPTTTEIQENPKATKSIEETTEKEEENIFSAPTQLLQPREPVDDDIFLAPTQVLLEDDESIKKSNESVRLSSESNDESMRLHLSETEPSTSNLNQEQQEQQQNTETQLEVLFELETQKLYVEEKTRRPDNPLSHLFAEEATEQYSEAGDTDDCNTGIDNKMQLKPIVSLVDIKKSKITLKDIQEASTSKIKKSYVKLERIRQEPTRRSNRNAKLADNEKYSPDGEFTEETNVEPIVENVKATRRQTKLALTTKVPEKQDNATNEENVVKEEKTTRRRPKGASSETSPRKPQKQDKATNEENSEAQEKTTDVKDVTKEKQREEIKKSTSKTKLLKSAEHTSEDSEEGDFQPNSSRHNTRGKRRDYKSIAKGKSSDENESKNAKGRITSKSFMREKIEELEFHVKEERPKRSDAKSIEETDSDDSVSTTSNTSKRLKRKADTEPIKEKEKKTITIEDTDESSIEINIRKKVARIEDSQECEPRPKRNTKRTASTKTASEAEETKESNLGRNKRVLKNAKQASKTKDEKIVIEDSDESILETRKKEAAHSEESVGRTITRRRNSQISPERNKRIPPNDICLNTPNSKRRKYEPLSVNISTSQLNSDALSEHKVVFTMLNDTNLENIVRKLGGSVVDSIHVCTVLVTNKISRSLKFLIAVALGKPIVHLKWIMDSEKRKKFLDPWDYLLEDTESEAKFQMSLKESLTISRNKKLMSGETILLAAAKNFQVLKEIIETSGGKCITRAPPKNTRTVVVCYEDEKSKYSRYLKQKTLIVVSAEAIFSGVLQQKLNWKQYVLS